MSRYKIPKQRTCGMCGRVGTRVFMEDHGRTICKNRPACVKRLCDKVFLDKPQGVWLTDMIKSVTIHGVMEANSEPGSYKATLEIAPDGSVALEIPRGSLGPAVLETPPDSLWAIVMRDAVS